eukprot:jgi/Ulvmu1/10540/UM064_0078.1
MRHEDHDTPSLEAVQTVPRCLSVFEQQQSWASTTRHALTSSPLTSSRPGTSDGIPTGQQFRLATAPASAPETHFVDARILGGHGSAGGEVREQVPGGVSGPRCQSHMSRLRRALEGCDDDQSVMLALCDVSWDMQPDLATITKLIARYAKTGNCARALAVYKSLHLLNLQPDVTVSNSALWACERAGHAGSAWLVYSAMLRGGIAPDSISYKALLTCLANTDHWQQCMECYMAAVKESVVVDGACTMAILFALKRAGKWRLAEALLFCVLSAVPAFSQIAADMCGDTEAEDEHGLCQLLHSLRICGSAWTGPASERSHALSEGYGRS